HESEIASVGRPGGIFFRDLASPGDVYDLAGLWRDKKDVPLLIPIVVGHVSDPLAIGRPGGGGLTLVADRKLRRPASGAGDDPQIISSADVGDEHDALAIRRPGRATHRARHVKALDGQALLVLFNLGAGLTLDLLGIGNRLGNRQSLGKGNRAHKDDDSK